MIHFKLAWHGLMHHRRQYGLFLLASIALVVVNFTFWATLLNPSIQHSANGALVQNVIGIGVGFVLLISVLFMFYVNSFLIRQRDQELGLYNILGLTRNDLRGILALENGLLFGATLIGGFVIGATFLKLIFQALRQLLQVDQIKEAFVPAAFVNVAGLFAVIFLGMLLYDIWRIHGVNPMDLWQASEKGEQEPKSHWIAGILGLVILAAGYWLAVTTKPTAMTFLQFMAAVILVVIGTYLVFITGSVVLLKTLKNRPNFYYQPNHFIAVSGMLYRMKQNGAGLASICLLCTSILVTMIAAMSLFMGSQNLVKQYNPYDILMITKDALNTQHRQTIQQVAQTTHIKTSRVQDLAMTTPSAGSLTTTSFTTANENAATQQLATVTLADYNRIQGTHQQLKANQVLLYTPDHHYHTTTLKLNGQAYQVKILPKFDFYFNYGHSIFQPVFVVTANAKIARQINPNPWVHITGFNATGAASAQTKFANQLQAKLALPNDSYSAKVVMAKFFRSIFGGFLFVGMLISLTMGLTTALVIYYKQLSEGYADQKRFKTMQQVGLSRRESKKAIHSQVLMVFMLPIVGAVVHLLFAYPAIKSVLQVFSMYDLNLLIGVSITTLGILVAAYLGLYVLTTKVYQRIVGA
ncbi:efflux ABC transporter, permease protein [Agrilactobacillus composti DSM 18527 = JCM 14202]|uniref:Efflux ABC transporter, permease protein n=1 Tax=Agrilactobacillus composti DSM 18527 = JCM 14202 TaxID=1423734 RepID=A0A0R1XTV4_9LACO|nr:ABC transporter permease [Agrilactobacillus composti]KRM31451.1 efflux ABC transporter, permease protein [Agrilactobacillus composti DSM 18527 = JCM 14202]